MTYKDLLIDWYHRIRFSQYAHYESAKLLERMNYWLGVPLILLSTFVGTSIFSSLGKSVNPSTQILIGLTSIMSATLAGLQTFLRLSERAESHRKAGAEYGSLRREIQEKLASCSQISTENTTLIREKIDRLAKESPHIPNIIWRKRESIIEAYQKNSR